MNVQLDQEELAIVIDVLRAEMQQLPTQARRADDPNYHAELRHLQHRTQTLLRKLEAASGGGAPTLHA